MKRKVSFCAWVFSAMAVLLVGCERGQSLAAIEERERSTRLYSNAVDDLQAGRMEAAIKGFERVVLEEPKSYSAHFQLATLLQDVKKDYIGAIAHYNAYLALRPASDKATVATDRVRLCERLLSAEIIRRAGGSASEQLKKDNIALTAARDKLQEELRRLQVDLEATNRVLARVVAADAMKKRLLDKLVADDSRAAPATAREAIAELRKMDAEDARRKLRPTDGELLDGDDEASPVTARIRKSEELRQMRAQLGEEDKRDAQRAASHATPPPKDAAHPGQLDGLFGGNRAKAKPAAGTRPATYTVQDGDTLFKIAKRFYGTSSMWRSIREANKATVSSDGRVRLGQVLTLP